MKRTLAAAAVIAAMLSPAFAQATPEALGDAFCAALVAEDVNALAALYTEDADSYGPDGTVQKGRSEIGASWKAFIEAYDGMTCALDKKGGKGDDKTHAAWGLWTITATPAAGGEKVTMKGRYMDVAVKTKEGWRYVADHASMLASAAAAAPAQQ